MTNPASILVLIFLAITFLQSGYDKLFFWKDNLEWLKGHFANTFLAKFVPISLLKILILELVSGTLSLIGIVQLIVNDGKSFGFWACVFSSVTLLLLLFGQRIAKDYEGSITIVIYFIPTVMGVYWLG